MSPSKLLILGLVALWAGVAQADNSLTDAEKKDQGKGSPKMSNSKGTPVDYPKGDPKSGPMSRSVSAGSAGSAGRKGSNNSAGRKGSAEDLNSSFGDDCFQASALV